MTKLEERRRRIDAIDTYLVGLLNKRATLALEIARIKQAQKLAIHDAGREEQVLANVRAVHAGPFPTESLDRIFGEIISACRSIQKNSAPAS